MSLSKQKCWNLYVDTNMAVAALKVGAKSKKKKKG